MIIGHKDKFLYLKKLSSKNKFPDSFIFFGPEGVGKLKLALYFSENIANKNDILVLTNNNYFINEERNIPVLKFEHSIKINEIRQIIQFASLKKTSQKKKRVIIIDNFHLAGEAAQNAFLKTLEEPNDDLVIILVTSNPEDILPTIKSRVQNINFGTLTKQEIKKIIKVKFPNVSKEAMKEAAFFSFGSVSRAYRVVESKEEWQKYKELVFQIINGEKDEKIKAIETVLLDKEKINIFFEEMFFYLINLFRKNPDLEKANFLNRFLNFYYFVGKNNLNLSWQLEYFFLFSKVNF